MKKREVLYHNFRSASVGHMKFMTRYKSNEFAVKAELEDADRGYIPYSKPLVEALRQGSPLNEDNWPRQPVAT